MIDLNNATERERLLKAIKVSREALAPFRKGRIALLKDYVGSWYSTNTPHTETIVNKMNQTARVYARFLAANNPRVKVQAQDMSRLPFARRFEVGINKLIADMALDVTFRLITLDAFFMLGIAKVTMADSGMGVLSAEDDVWYDVGQPWVERISMDDWFGDMTAKELSKMRFAGDRYRVPFARVKSEPSFDKSVVRKLTATSKDSISDAEERAAAIAAGADVDDDDLEPMIWLMDVWLPSRDDPHSGRLATFACDQELPPLAVRDWTGTQGGPYKYMCLGYVPDNVIPTSPASNLKALHDVVNKCYRKLKTQTWMQKDIIAYPDGGEDDADRIRRTKHGEYVRVRDPKNVTMMKLGGPDPALNAFALAVDDKFDMQAGNLKAAGGLGQQAETLGQEEIIQGNVASQQADLQFQVVQFAADVCWELGNLMWSDEYLEIQASEEVGPFGDRVDASWYPGRREGQFDEYDFRVEPYSMIFKTPTQKLQEIFGTMREIAPLWPMFQASGMSLDVRYFLDVIADLQDRPELKRLFTNAFPADQLGGDQNTIRQSPVTSRQTVRKNVPTGGTAESRSAILQQVMLGGGQTNQQQRASLSRVPA